MCHNNKWQNMSASYHEKKQQIKYMINRMTDQDILNFIYRAFVFRPTPKIVFYTKNDNSIVGMIEVNKKMMKFEIWFSVPYNSVAVTIAKITKVLGEE